MPSYKNTSAILKNMKVNGKFTFILSVGKFHVGILVIFLALSIITQCKPNSFTFKIKSSNCDIAFTSLDFKIFQLRKNIFFNKPL